MKTAKNRLDIEYKKVATYALLTGFFLFLLFFTYQKTSHIWRGVNLTIQTPENGQAISDELIYLEGSAARAIELTVNGNPILVEQNGRFYHPLPIQDGLNIVTVTAKDKFKNIETETLQINGIIN